MIYNLYHKPIKPPGSRLMNAAIHMQKYFLPETVSKAITHTKLCQTKDVAGFANTYRITPQMVEGCESMTPEECWAQFETVNDFFIRRRVNLPPENTPFREQYIREQYRFATGKLRAPAGIESRVIVSPADNFCVLLEPQDVQRKVWIKGDQFTAEELFQSSDVTDQLLVVFRLAPHHYHRFHCPLTGTVQRMQFVGTEYLSVNPKLVRSSTNVLTRNVRMVMQLKTISGEIVHLAIIGASCVGSIQITHKRILRALGKTQPVFAKSLGRRAIVFSRPPQIRVNEELGNFQFGGSCIAMSVPVGVQLSRISEIIQAHTAKRAETQLEVGQVLFTV